MHQVFQAASGDLSPQLSRPSQLSQPSLLGNKRAATNLLHTRLQGTKQAAVTATAAAAALATAGGLVILGALLQVGSGLVSLLWQAAWVGSAGRDGRVVSDEGKTGNTAASTLL